MRMSHSLLASFLVFAIGAVVYPQSGEQKHNRSFVVTFSRYNTSAPDKSQTLVQLVSARGRSLVKIKGSDGSDVEHFVPQFAPDNWKAWGDREAYLRSAHVIRSDEFLGHTVYVFRQDVGGQTLERWYAPETGPVPLKEILETANAATLITEATRIEFREVSDEEVEPNLNLVRNNPS